MTKTTPHGKIISMVAGESLQKALSEPFSRDLRAFDDSDETQLVIFFGEAPEGSKPLEEPTAFFRMVSFVRNWLDNFDYGPRPEGVEVRKSQTVMMVEEQGVIMIEPYWKVMEEQ